MNISSYGIYSPVSDQSIVIANMLRKYYPNADVVGVTSENIFHGNLRRHYNRLVPELAMIPVNQLNIPTNAATTENFLKQGDIVIGKVTLSQRMLKLFDKPWALSQASAAGISIPTTWQSLDEVNLHPFFYKQRYERGGGARGIAYSHKSVPRRRKNELIFQEYINSPGTYGVGFLAKQGNLLAMHTHFESISIPKEGGSAICVEKIESEALANHTKQLVKSLNYSGWGLAEFKYCPRRKEFVFMEINAKFWASCELSFLNEPLFLKLLFDINSEEKPVGKITFVDRACCRGAAFVIRHLPELLGDTELRNYSGLPKSIISAFTPHSLISSLRRRL